MEERLARLIALRETSRADLERLVVERQAITDLVQRQGRANLTPDEAAEFRAKSTEITKKQTECAGLDERVAELVEEIERSGRLSDGAAAVRRAQARVEAVGDGRGGAGWAARAASALQRMGGESRAVVAGSVDVPSLIPGGVTAIPHPTRIVDLLTNRQMIESNAYEYFVQTSRVNAAVPVADGATKPVSTLTMTSVADRCRVHAHLSEPAPVRLHQDTPTLISWLEREMLAGVLDSIERTAISGDGTGEDQTGVLNATGTTDVAFTGDVASTLRSAITSLQQLGEQPNAWVLSPADAEQIDLLRWGASGGFLSGGYEHDGGTGFGSSANVFGDVPQRVVSPSVPEGTALLADWSQLKLFVREQTRLDVDVAGDLFSSNRFQMRAEARVGIAVTRPQSFAIISLA